MVRSLVLTVHSANRGSRYIHECGRSADSPPFFAEARHIVETLKASLPQGHNAGKDDTKQLDSLLAEVHHNFGCVGTETNDPKGTLAHFERFNELMMQEIGDGAQGKDKRLAISWNELGNAYMLNGMWEKGEESFKRSISTMQRVENFEWTDVSFPFVNLGLAYWLTNRLEEAMKTLMEGLGHREAVHGVDDKESFMYVSLKSAQVFNLLTCKNWTISPRFRQRQSRTRPTERQP